MGSSHRSDARPFPRATSPTDESIRRRHWHEDRDWELECSVATCKMELRRHGQRIKDWLLSLPADRESYGLVHSDLHQWNMLRDGRELWPIDFDNLHYDWFLSDFTTVIINVVLCQQRSYARGEYDKWTGGRKDGQRRVHRLLYGAVLE